MGGTTKTPSSLLNLSQGVYIVGPIDNVSAYSGEILVIGKTGNRCYLLISKDTLAFKREDGDWIKVIKLGGFPYVGAKFSNHVDKQCIALDSSGGISTDNALVVTFWGTVMQVQLAFVQNQNGTLSQISVRSKQTSSNWSDVSFTNLL